MTQKEPFHYEALFAEENSSSDFLIVTVRKGDWFKVIYDDAGREGWIKPANRGEYLDNESWLRRNVFHILSGLPKNFYQLYKRENSEPFIPINPKNSFKIIKINGNWAQVLFDTTKIGWIRWRDDEGRFSVGIAAENGGSK